MSTVQLPAAQPKDDRVVLYDVPWETYEVLRSQIGDRPIRLTYDGRNLEIMSPSRWHELAGELIGAMIRALGFELEIEIGSGGSTTFRRPDLERALEPDRCFWIAHEAAVRGKLEIDLSVDPPPDLAIEIDISPSKVDRPRIYAALNVPEIWRYDGDELHIELLGADGRYHLSDRSQSFPFLPVAELPRFLLLARHDGEMQALRAFVDWVRERGFQKP